MFMLFSSFYNFGCLKMFKIFNKGMRLLLAILLTFTLTACGPVTVATIAVVAVLINSDDGSRSSTNIVSSSSASVFAFTSGSTATAIDENSGTGQIVYTATSSDATATYSLLDDDSGSFTINNITGEVTLIINPIYTNQSNYSFEVLATNSSNDNVSIIVTLAVNDITAPSLTSATTIDVDENIGVEQVVYIATSDDSSATYSLSGTDSSKFTIDANSGALTLIGDPDFEDQSSYSFIITATDTASNSSPNTITLSINNIALAAFNLNTIEASPDDIKQMSLTWDLASEHPDDSSSITYTLCEKDTSQSNNCNELTFVTNELTTTTTVSSLVSALSTDYFILASSGTEIETSSELNIDTDEINKMIGYVKASNTEAEDHFGSWTDAKSSNSLALSSDGRTLAIGAPSEDSQLSGVITDGTETSNSDSSADYDSGAVYLFSNSSGKWEQTAYIKASNQGMSDKFGVSVALNDDGTTLAVGAYLEDNAATGVENNNEHGVDNTIANNAGAVYIFTNDSGTWEQSTYLKASNVGASDEFGYSLALNGDATVLAVGAYQEDNGATGVITDGSETTDTTTGATASGAVYLFTKSGTTWSQTAYVKAANTEKNDRFGRSLTLSDDGHTLAVGAQNEENGASGITNSSVVAEDGEKIDSGAVYVFSDNCATCSSVWSQTAYIKASNTGVEDEFGRSLSLNDDGTVLAVGAYLEDNGATGVITDGSEVADSTTATDSGAVYLFENDGSNWAQTAYIKASNTDDSDGFGYHIALSGDGNSLVISSYQEANGIAGIIVDNSETTDTDSQANSGAVYLFTNEASSWTQVAYIKASNTGASDLFGSSVAINYDGTTIAVGAADESNSATGIITDGSEITGDEGFAESSGAVYIY